MCIATHARLCRYWCDLWSGFALVNKTPTLGLVKVVHFHSQSSLNTVFDLLNGLFSCGRNFETWRFG